MAITGKDLVEMGYEPGAWFKDAISHANSAGLAGDDLIAYLDAQKPAPKIGLQDAIPFHRNITAESELERANVDNVIETMEALVKTPTITAAAVMPDACPAGPMGTIPVGGVVSAKGAIHPGMHSSDICCSVMVTEYPGAAPKDILDAIHTVTHFGPGGRPNGKRFTLSPTLMDDFRENDFLKDKKIFQAAQEHLGTQGDGNHFAFVGVSESTGNTCLVTHHGSRGPGAGLYKLGMRTAEKMRRKLSPDTLKGNAWIPFDTAEGQSYWEALQLIRKWTKANHNCLHAATAEVARAKVGHRFWNEHNFVFRDGDDFYHAKGATPVDIKFLPDTDGLQIVPLNMAEPVLIVRGSTTDNNLGFAPHGAGRNYSRTAHKRAKDGQSERDIFDEETAGLDVRFFMGNIDISELPSAYKSAAAVRSQMDQFGLAEVVDTIQPYGSIMAGDWERDAPWRKKKAERSPSSTG
jgi:tRNA-splicing ligase RtcB (3'-phosphate/5'-hydroxy nucleic acid ligase)